MLEDARINASEIKVIQPKASKIWLSFLRILLLQSHTKVIINALLTRRFLVGCSDCRFLVLQFSPFALAFQRKGSSFRLSFTMILVLINYLSGRKQYTEVNNQKSSTEPINCGVPQGSLLGPRLYTIQVNDLPESTSEGELSLFADDTNVYCIGTDIEEVIDILNRIMAEVYDWCVKNKLTVHPGKSEAMILWYWEGHHS